MSAYGIAHMRKVSAGPQIVEYLRRIDATLRPFGGRFIVHGGEVEVLEGSWPGSAIVIEFPDLAAARGWDRSAAYQEILRLRTDNSESAIIIIHGVGLDPDGTRRRPGRRARR